MSVPTLVGNNPRLRPGKEKHSDSLGIDVQIISN